MFKKYPPYPLFPLPALNPLLNIEFSALRALDLDLPPLSNPPNRPPLRHIEIFFTYFERGIFSHNITSNYVFQLKIYDMKNRSNCCPNLIRKYPSLNSRGGRTEGAISDLITVYVKHIINYIINQIY